MMSIYLIGIINRSPKPPEMKEKMKNDIWIFLFIASNGTLLISVIFLVEVFSAQGFAPFGLGLTILIAGIICYVRKINDNCLAEFYSDNKIQSLCRIPCFILKIVRYTFECCRCKYYDIVTVTQ